MERNYNVEEIISKISDLGGRSNKKIVLSSLPILDKDIIQRSLVFKVITDLEVRRGALLDALPLAWQSKNPVDIREYGDGIFLATFSHERDARRVLMSGPWVFRRDFIVMQRCCLGKAPYEYNFNEIELWVHITGIPIEYINEECLRSIVSSFGVACGDLKDSLHKWGTYVRVKVALPIVTGLISSIDFPLPTNPGHKLQLQYEKLRRFCRFCGCIGHDRLGCNLLEELESCLCSDEISPGEIEVLEKLKCDRFSDNIKAISPTHRRVEPNRDTNSRRPRSYGDGAEVVKDRGNSTDSSPKSAGGGAEIEISPSNNQRGLTEKLHQARFSSSLTTKVTPELLHVGRTTKVAIDPIAMVPVPSPIIMQLEANEKSEREPGEDSSTAGNSQGSLLGANPIDVVACRFNPGPSILHKKKHLRREKTSRTQHDFLSKSPSTPESRKRAFAFASTSSPLDEPKRRKLFSEDMTDGVHPERRSLQIDDAVNLSGDIGINTFSSAVVAVQPRRSQ